MSLSQALWMAFVQGITELFPISSLGHAVIVPALLGWHIEQNTPEFLSFLVLLHVGTAVALAFYFWRDWLELIGAAFGYGAPEIVSERRKLLGYIAVASIPAAIVGFALEKTVRHFFGSPILAASFLAVNGLILFAGERLRDPGNRTIGVLTWRRALAIGVWQCTALIPGVSRSGVTMVGGLLAGLRHQEAARFSFLIATPVIGGAGMLEIPKLLRYPNISSALWMAGVVAMVTAYGATALMVRYFRQEDFHTLYPFALYSLAAGIVSLIVLLS